MRRAGVASPEPGVTARVLQAKTGLVSLGHFTSSDNVQQVVVAEGVHAVVMSEGVEQNRIENRVEMNNILVVWLKQGSGMPLRPQFYLE